MWMPCGKRRAQTWWRGMANPLVIDASFAIRLLLPNPQQSTCQALVTQWQQKGTALCAPTLWMYEMTSVLCKAVYFDQLTLEEGEKILILAQHLSVHLFIPDEQLTAAAYNWTLRLKRAAVYDSFYLALAEELHGELWTADKKLAGASRVEWVHSIPAVNDQDR